MTAYLGADRPRGLDDTERFVSERPVPGSRKVYISIGWGMAHSEGGYYVSRGRPWSDWRRRRVIAKVERQIAKEERWDDA